MLIVHLCVGVLFGATAAVVGALMGVSFWGAVGFYILGANVGLLASIPAALLARRAKRRNLGRPQQRASTSSTPVTFAVSQVKP